MYCKLYIHCDSKTTVVSILENQFGSCHQRISTYYFSKFDISIQKNKEADAEKIHIFPDGFLYYEIISDMELYADHAEVTDSILHSLRKHHIPVVASCDYEKELTQFALRRKPC